MSDSGIRDIPLDKIAVVGEMHLSVSFDIEEHYLVVIAVDGGVAEIFVSEKNPATVVTEKLRAGLGVDVEYRLLDCGVYDSRIMYPPAMKDQPLYVFAAKTITRKFLGIFSSTWTQWERTYTPELARYLEHLRHVPTTRDFDPGKNT